jgi:hypothetical protein
MTPVLNYSLQIDTDFLKCEDFLIGDVGVEGARHLLFSTPFQLEILKRSKRWFMDGTFKVILKL